MLLVHCEPKSYLMGEERHLFYAGPCIFLQVFGHLISIESILITQYSDGVNNAIVFQIIVKKLFSNIW